jgi:hypothetical protein
VARHNEEFTCKRAFTCHHTATTTDEMSIVSRSRRAAKGSIYYVPKVRARPVAL